MRVRAISNTLQIRPAAIAAWGSPSSKLHISTGTSYEVHAITVFKGEVGYQVVDDLELPSWYPSWLFAIVDNTIPADWIANSFADEPMLVVGPDFVARSRADYEAMVHKEPEPVAAFWRRLESLGM